MRVCILGNSGSGKYDPEDQNKVLAFLVDWIRAYPTRDDATGHAAHQRVFDAFGGRKRRITELLA